MELLDNLNVLRNRDPEDALGVAASEWRQLLFEPKIENPNADQAEITQLVVTGMGGSALAAQLAKDWLDLSIPLEIVKYYELPAYVGPKTLVIASSYSGNTEETLSALHLAIEKGTQCAVIASGGQLIEVAQEHSIPFVQLETGVQPRMMVFANLVALVALLEQYGLTESRVEELRAVAPRLQTKTEKWLPAVVGTENPAKQLAMELLGKTPVIYAGYTLRSVAYKWKISFNENAKNVAFCNEVSEFNHNEFIGWTSHPVEKPFGVIDLTSNFDHPQVKKRFIISDRLLSGKRPHSITTEMQGESVIEQMLYGCIMGDFVSIYLAILNGVDPTKVDLIEKLKTELG